MPNQEFPKLERQLTSTFDNMVPHVVKVSEVKTDMKPAAGSSPQTSGIFPSSNISTSPSQPQLKFKTGEATNIGGGHENQDKSMCFRAGTNEEHLVMAVFDGHGRELGELAATVARDFFRSELQKADVLNLVEKDPEGTMSQLFRAAHEKIKESFKRTVQEAGEWEVSETPEGYLIKKQRVQSPTKRNYYQVFETNVHGGTTATVVIILNSKRLIVANVGDSTALFGGVSPNGRISFKELSSEHSPESIHEFTRVKSCRHYSQTQTQTQSQSQSSMTIDAEVSSSSHRESKCLRFVYDVTDETAVATPKHSCPPIFKLDQETGEAKRSGVVGHYYKNVRCEWATLVTTPPTARFQDALAFTRSLGDLHLQVYGVSHVPEVQEFDLSKLHDGASSVSNSSILLVCTDGVWDNWKYDDIIGSVFGRPSFTKTVEKTTTDAQTLTDEVMRENLKLAKEYFGNQADNMTCVLCVVQSQNEN